MMSSYQGMGLVAAMALVFGPGVRDDEPVDDLKAFQGVWTVPSPGGQVAYKIKENR